MASLTPRRKDALAVHSLQRFVFSVPDLAEAAKFYRTFGLDVREVDGRLDLYAFGHPHRWASIYRRPGGKRLEYIAFGAYPEDYDALVDRLRARGVSTTKPHPLADDEGVWIHQDAWFNLGRFDAHKGAHYGLKRAGNGVYAFVIEGSATINGQALERRDGLGVWDIAALDVQAGPQGAEILLMEVPMQLS